MRIVLILLVVGIIGYFGNQMVGASGVLLKLENQLVEECRRIDIAPGAEDVQIDPETNIAFITAMERRDWYNDGVASSSEANGVYALDLSSASLEDIPLPVKVSGDAPANFNPHGLYLWSNDTEKRLFVVNHPTTGEEIIEIFSVGADNQLTHLESVSFDAMHSPNDVVAVGPRQFYATNDKGYEGGIMEMLEAYLALPFSSAVYYDGKNGSIAAKGLTYANGINISPDGQTIYIAEFLKRRITSFSREDGGKLKKITSMNVPTGPDNIDVGTDGTLWTAGHSKVFDFLAHAEDPNEIAPSHGARLNPATGKSETVFVSTKGEINGSSVAAVGAGKLVIGPVFEGHVMVCPQP